MITCYILAAALWAGAHTPDPKALVDSGVRAMGGPMRTLRITGIQHEFMLGNAERADGPWRRRRCGGSPPSIATA